MGVFQGLLILVLAPFIGVRLDLELVLKLVPLLFLLALSLTSLGVALAARMKSMEGFQMIMQFLLMPMIFLSGALFPMRDLPAWMDVLVKINPVTYAVDPLRQVVFEAQGLPKAMLALLPQFGLGVSVFNHAMTLRDDVLVISLFGTVMITVAVWLFSLQD